MIPEGMPSLVIEIKQSEHYGLYIVQSGRALADIPDHAPGPDRSNRSGDREQLKWMHCKAREARSITA
jgi:hypothetical protein